jgi:hypothetical protein
MIPITIQCSCGQPYTFEVEPADGQMPGTVACPTCGVDGTDAANGYLAQVLAAEPVAAAPAAPAASRLRVSSAPPAQSAAPRRVPGTVNRSQAEIQARAKISWGEPPPEVTAYLVVQGFSRQEASELVNELFKERASAIRIDGIKKVFIGGAMVCAPIVVLLMLLVSGSFNLYGFALSIMLGVYGLYVVIKGILMVIAPKSQPGDVADQ